MDHLRFGSESKRPRTEEAQFEENEVVEDQLPVQNIPQPEESTELNPAEVNVCEKSD